MTFRRDEQQGNIWLSADNINQEYADSGIQPVILPSEDAVGEAMLNELLDTASQKSGGINIALLGGRGAQAFHRLLGEKARTTELDDVLNRLNVFTQDALAPMSMGNSLSFVRDFDRILGPDFFTKINSFTPMQTDLEDLEAGLSAYLEKLQALGGLDIFFIGHGPEDNAASHLAYIKPGSGAKAEHMAGLIPISSSILEHHISKFKAGGSDISESDENECRAAAFILTLGPAAILSAKKVIQSVVDASTAPAKVQTYANVMNTPLSEDAEMAKAQLDANPGLWIRLHPNKKSFVLPDVLN